MTVRAKICGLSTPETVRAAADGEAKVRELISFAAVLQAVTGAAR